MTHTLTKRLLKLDVGQGFKALETPVTPAQVSACYRQGKKAGVKVTLRILPDGLWIYRKA